MKKDLNEKFTLYERNHIREYWLIDPGSRTMHVYRLESTGRYGEALVLEQGAEVPCPIGEGIVVRLAEVFAAGE
jgi:Uma2 family endonuclease